MNTRLLLLPVALFLAYIIACNTSTNPKKVSDSTDAPHAATQHVEEATRGEALFMKSDCKSCHDRQNNIIGPSLAQIAARYAFNDANISHLAKRVIDGVKMNEGVWGKQEMTPHPDVNQQDAELMVKYILSLPPDVHGTTNETQPYKKTK